MKTLCIYHGNCADGFGAAWAVRKAFGGENVEFHPGVYQSPPPDVRGRDVVMVDFSYKYDVICDLSFKAKSLIIVDHHKSAAEDLGRLPAIREHLGYEGTLHELRDHCAMQNMPLVGALFDMERSGAGLAWDFFNRGQPRPALIDHIEDRDLWRFALDGTREIQANVFSHPYDFDVWDRLMAADVSALRSEGAAIERKHFKDIAELLKVCQRRLEIGGHSVPVASLPYTLTSDAGHEMAQGEPFAACYWDTERGRVFSLRSADDGMDVSAIAKDYGGGGHKHAAGFEVPRDHPLAVS